jgi:hypothetical protein
MKNSTTPAKVIALPGAAELASYLVNTPKLAKFGAPYGSTFTARLARPDERPPAGSLVLAWLDDDRYLLHLVGYVPHTALCREGVTLDDGKTRKTFCACEVRFEAIGRVVAGKSRRRGKPAGAVNMGAWLSTHPRPIRNLIFAEREA